MSIIHQLQGQAGENLAVEYFNDFGCQILQRNYRIAAGEIDIIMLDAEDLVFVEVKARRLSQFAAAAETVTVSKQLKLIKAAQNFLQSDEKYNQYFCRFDVFTIQFKQPHCPSSLEQCQQRTDIKLNWIKHAFML